MRAPCSQSAYYRPWPLSIQNSLLYNFRLDFRVVGGKLAVPNLTRLNLPSRRKSPVRKVGAFLMSNCRVGRYLVPGGGGHSPSTHYPIYLAIPPRIRPVSERYRFFCLSASAIISRILRWKRFSLRGFFFCSWIWACIFSSSRITCLITSMMPMVIRFDTK